MQWTTPDFKEICLSMEVTGYVNTDEDGGNLVTKAAHPQVQPTSGPPTQADKQA